MKLFFGDEPAPNMANGVLVQNTQHRGCLIRCRFAGFLGDEKALKETIGCKGSSGTKPCYCCKNVLGTQRGDIAGRDPGGHLVSIAELDQNKFDEFNDQELYDMVDDLAEKSQVLNQTDFARLEQIYGVNHIEGGLLTDRSLRCHFKPVTHGLWDWTHILFVHGCGSIELQLFAKERTQL